MKKSWLLIIILTKISINFIYGQNLTDSLFISPIKIPLKVSGGFGELRSNHIHSGVDFRTNSKIGEPVYASANGFISRIKVEPGGYGKAVYIEHPSGYTTVYAHLDAFREDINAYVRKNQYEVQKFPVDLFPEKNEILIKQGDIIAFSGNSGGSSGPHLHFEFRDTKTQMPIHPFIFKIPVKDTSAPSFYSLEFYPLSGKSKINGRSKKLTSPVIINKRVFLSKLDTIKITGPIGIGTEVFDAIDTGSNKTGYFSLQMDLDSVTIFRNEISSFGFNETRYVNSLIDYREYFNTGKKISKLFIDPNNKLSTYRENINRGIIDISDTLPHKIKITATDVSKNSSTISFIIKLDKKKYPETKITTDTCTRLFSYKTDNSYRTDSFKLYIPDNALYTDYCFKYFTLPQKSGYYSKIYQVKEYDTPFQYPIEISIKPSGISDSLLKKAIIARLDENNFAYSIGGIFENNFLKAKTYFLGNFTIIIDTIAPKISPLRNFTTEYQGIRKEYIAFKITDNLSGIRIYSGFINDQWALFEYDAKNNLLTHQLDSSRFEYSTETNIKIEVSDLKDNVSSFTTKFKPIK